MVDQDDLPWEGQCADAAYTFALRRAEWSARNPHSLPGPLNEIIGTLMTELWDRNFSQTDIRVAFDAAVRGMPRYAAGSERRSPTSTRLATDDWRAAEG